MAESESRERRIWVVSELYYPEDTSTGYYLTRIAEGLAERGDPPVHVLCGRPSYASRGVETARTETHHGVAIRRCWGTTWNKNHLLPRIVNLITLSLSMFFHAGWRFRRGDRVLVVTNPPLLPFVISWACRLKGADCALLIHDVYPDALIGAGLLKPTSLFTKILDRAVRGLYRTVDTIVVLGRDMRDLVLGKLKSEEPSVRIIPNWADTDLIQPRTGENRILRKLGLSKKFVVQYSGNMGRSHNLEAVALCAERLEDRRDIHFLIAGSGAKKPWLEQTVKEKKLDNVTIIDRLPREELPELLTAGDVALIPFVRGMAGVSVPSRLYNMLAAGMPIIALVDENSEVAKVIDEEQAGRVVPPDDVDSLERAILELAASPETRTEMGRRARRAAETKYQYATILDAYCKVMGVQQPFATDEDKPLSRAA